MTNEMRQLVRERLDKIAAANGGRLTPEHVVDDARDPSSPLHGLFDWDVERSAMRAWLQRARDIIASVPLIVNTERKELACPVWVRDPSADAEEQGYVAVTTLRDNKTQAAQAVEYECARATAALQRARAIASVLGLRKMADEALGAVERFAVRAARKRRKRGTSAA